MHGRPCSSEKRAGESQKPEKNHARTSLWKVQRGATTPRQQRVSENALDEPELLELRDLRIGEPVAGGEPRERRAGSGGHHGSAGRRGRLLLSERTPEVRIRGFV